MLDGICPRLSGSFDNYLIGDGLRDEKVTKEGFEKLELIDGSEIDDR
jgi:hypothetical protein